MIFFFTFIAISFIYPAHGMLPEPSRSYGEIKWMMSKMEKEILKALGETSGRIKEVSFDKKGNYIIKTEKCRLEIKTKYTPGFPPQPNWSVGKAQCQP